MNDLNVKPDFMYGKPLPCTDWIWDLETYPNIFTAAFRNVATKEQRFFEISSRKNDFPYLLGFIFDLNLNSHRLVGFNSVGFDYPVLHWITNNKDATVIDIYAVAQKIIDTPFNQRFSNMIHESDHVVTQIDLYKIHHFDNVSKATGLKTLEINMRMNRVEDLPFPVGKILTDEEMDVLVNYNWDDIDATELFYYQTLDMIKFREELSRKHGKSFLNHNDTKIGKDYFIMELEKAMPGCCYDNSTGRRVMRQSPRTSIDLNDVVFDYVSFENPEFQRIHEWFKAQTITETKGVFKDISCNVGGMDFDFGTGGIHGSIESTVVSSDIHAKIYDWDVASYYPNLSIKNNLFPEHLSSNFCELYEGMYQQRKGYSKGTPENAMLKLALNGTYGDSNNKYSPFYDPKFTMSITINGQLLLCMLAEQLMKTPGIEMIQINTDGLTVKCPNDYVEHMNDVCKWLEELTKLELECAEYSRMMIRDVNNYIAEYTDGKLKRKGKYAYGKDLGWNQNFSSQVVAKAAEASLVRGVDVEEFIREHTILPDFLVSTKVPRSSRLALDVSGVDQYVPNIIRYVVSNDGYPLNKIMPPAGPEGHYKRANGILESTYQEVINSTPAGSWDERIHTKNQSKYETRRIGINTGFNVTVCNDIQELNRVDINYDYYITQANKLVKPLVRE